MKLADIKTLGDKSQIDEITLDILEVKSEKKGQYGTMYSVAVADGSVRGFATFSLKQGTPATYVGKRVTLKTSHNKEGAMTGIRTDANGSYINLWITDSAKITIDGGASPPPAQAPYKDARQPGPSQPSLPPNLVAKRLAEEWVAVYNWTLPIFAPVLGPDNTREVATGVLIDMRKRGIDILPPPKLDWKAVIYKDLVLGKWEPERMRKAIVKILQGAKVADNIRDAFLEAAKEAEYVPLILFWQMVADNGIDEDSVNSVLLRDFKELSAMDSNEITNLIVDPKFLESAKQLQASKATPIDDIDI